MTPLELKLDHLQAVCPKTPPEHLLDVLPHLRASLGAARISAPVEAAMYVSMTAEETQGFTRFEENLHYSKPERILEIWPHHFRSLEEAARYTHNPERLGNRVYADRMGNGDEESGEGWLYRGRAAPMITGRDAYRACEASTGLPLVAHPELASRLEHAFTIGAWFWVSRHIGPLADTGNVELVTLHWNGGRIGLPERQSNFTTLRKLFGVDNVGVA